MNNYLSVDIEYSWDSEEGAGGIISLWACVVWDINSTFYRELKPINENYDDDAMKVASKWLKTIWDDITKLSSKEILDRLQKYWIDAKVALLAYTKWIEELNLDLLVEAAYPIKFDGGLMAGYFKKYKLENPLGYGWMDAKSMLQWFLCDDTASFRDLGIKGDSDLPHNALQDAQVQSIYIEFLLWAMKKNIERNWELVNKYHNEGKEGFIKDTEVGKQVVWVREMVWNIHDTGVWENIDYRSILN